MAEDLGLAGRVAEALEHHQSLNGSDAPADLRVEGAVIAGVMLLVRGAPKASRAWLREDLRHHALAAAILILSSFEETPRLMRHPSFLAVVQEARSAFERETRKPWNEDGAAGAA